MDDQWAAQIYESSFGGVRLDVLSTQDDLSRALARYKYPHRDGADVEDMGGEELVTNCRVIFFPRDGQDARSAFLDFIAVTKRGVTQTFVHPLFGEIRAKAGKIGVAAEFGTRDTIMVDVEFVEDTAEAGMFPAGAGAPVASSVDEVKSIGTDIDNGLVDVNDGLIEDDEEPISTTVHTEAITAVTAWEEDDTLTERDVRFAASTLANRIDSETDRLELAFDVSRYPLVTAFTRLHWAVRRAAEAFIQRTPRLFEITVAAPRPLLVIAAETYGADQASTRYEQLLSLNDIRTPNRVPRGTVLKAQVPGDPLEARLRRPHAA
jgi:prophage DNA circulation protein